MAGDIARRIDGATRQLCRAVDALHFGQPVTHVYNPLAYAAAAHARYVRTYAISRKRVIFLGMNPGPFGMVQTGVPFGDVAVVRDWLGLEGRVGKPAREHPKRLVLGFACPRSEVSGTRLWGAIASHYGTQACRRASWGSSGSTFPPAAIRWAPLSAVSCRG